MAQLGPTVCVVKPGGEMSMWKRQLQPSKKLSRHRKVVKAVGQYTVRPNVLPDMQCIMLIKKLIRRSTRILTRTQSRRPG